MRLKKIEIDDHYVWMAQIDGRTKLSIEMLVAQKIDVGLSFILQGQVAFFLNFAPGTDHSLVYAFYFF